MYTGFRKIHSFSQPLKVSGHSPSEKYDAPMLPAPAVKMRREVLEGRNKRPGWN